MLTEEEEDKVFLESKKFIYNNIRNCILDGMQYICGECADKKIIFGDELLKFFNRMGLKICHRGMKLDEHPKEISKKEMDRKLLNNCGKIINTMNKCKLFDDESDLSIFLVLLFTEDRREITYEYKDE